MSTIAGQDTAHSGEPTRPPIIPFDSPTALAAILWLFIAVAFWCPAVRDPLWWGDDWWDRAFTLAGVARASIVRYGQFPFWNPYMSGGLPLLANPASAFLSPSFLAVLLAGEVVGTKLRTLWVLYAGLLGGYFLGRRVGKGPFTPYVIPAVYLLSSWYPLYVSHGHDEFIAFAYLPWVILFCLAADERTHYAIISGLFLALMCLEGGIYAVPYTILLLGLYALHQTLTQRRFLPISILLIILAFAFLLSAVKLLPVLDYLRDNPRRWGFHERIVPLDALRNIFLGRDQVHGEYFKGSFYYWHEYGSYVGWIALGLALAGSLLAWRQSIFWLWAGALFIALMVGDFGPLAPWHWLHKMPVFSSLHDTPRFRIIPTFCLAMLSGIGLEQLWIRCATRFRSRRQQIVVRIIFGVIVAGLVADLFTVNRGIFSRVSSRPPECPGKPGAFVQVRNLTHQFNPDFSYISFLQNTGLTNNYEPMAMPIADVRAVTDQGYRGEIWLDRGGEVSTVFWSPNRLIYRVRCPTPQNLIVNQRYDKGWRSTDRRPVRPYNGLISLQVMPHDVDLTLIYRPRTFLVGCALSLFGLGLSLAIWPLTTHER
jgi:hypothetical protein